jgi:methylase of polypeptide subunit release factors
LFRTRFFVHKWFFGYRPLIDNSTRDEYWDWTTLALRRAMRKHLRPNNSFLDMGTGPFAVLAIYANIKLGCKHVSAVDYLKPLLSAAKENADSLGLEVEFIYSDLFDNINVVYDVIAFNAPYLDIEEGRRRGILENKTAELRFSGGAGGGETIERFLHEAPRFLSEKGKLLLGVNHFHISRTTVHDIISSSDMIIERLQRNPPFPGTVYVLIRRAREE